MNMKTKGFILNILIIWSGTVFSQNTPFKEWLRSEMIRSTYITKDMMEMAPDMKIGNRQISDFSDLIDQIEIYTNDKNPNVAYPGTSMVSKAIELAEKGGYDLTLQLGEPNIEIIFFSKKSSKEPEIISDLIMIMREAKNGKIDAFNSKCTIIRLLGRFSIDDIREIAPDTGKKK